MKKTNRSRVLMLFLDGVGIGHRDKESNPFFRYGFTPFSAFFGALPSLDNQFLHTKSASLFPVDARMGVEGIPQSGTGQASIFCGVNAPSMCGLHYGPFPHSLTLPTVRDKNIFCQVKTAGLSGFFANAYPRVFFEYLRSGKKRLSVTTLSYTSAGCKLNTSTDVRRGRALTAEITNVKWNENLHYKLPILSPAAAGRRLLRIAAMYDFTLYEYFLTDYIGHGRIVDREGAIHRQLETFLFPILFEKPENLFVFIVSDHGNYEDISDRKHTVNPALGFIAGNNARELSGSITSLADILPAVMSILKQ